VGLPLAAALNIWIDEGFTMHTTGAGVRYAWAQAIAFEAQPPLYFVLEAAWRTLDETSVLFARFSSIVFAAAAVAVIVAAARRISPSIPPFVVALGTALNPLFIWTAVEMRVYALILLVGAVLTWTFFEGFLVTPRSRRAQVWYCVFALVGIYAQYYVGFLLAAHAITLLAMRRSSLRAFSVAVAIVALGFAPFVRVALVHVAASGEFVSRVTFIGAVHTLANVVFVFVLPHDINWAGPAKLAGFALAAAVAIAVVAIGRPVAADKTAAAFGLHWLITVAIFALLLTVSGIPVDPLRHLVIAGPPTILAMFLCISSLTRRHMSIGSVAASTFLIFALSSLWVSYRPPASKLGDWRRVAATISAEDASTAIAVFPAEAALPLSEYLRAATIAIPQPMPFTLDYNRAMTLTNESQVARVLDPAKLHVEKLWIVTTGICRSSTATDPTHNCRYLEAYLQHHYRIIKTIAFRGALVRLYALGQTW
jgi:hypothetical protein